MSERLSLELTVFERHRQEWERDHARRFVVIHGEDVIGFFDTFELASQTAIERFGPRDVLIKRVAAETPSQLSPAVMYGLTVAEPDTVADFTD